MQSGWGQPPQGYPQPPYGHGPQPGWARPRIDRSLLRPKAGWYAAAAIPLLLGIAGLATCVVLAVNAFPGRPHAFTAPGARELRLKKGDDQTIYRHTRGAGAPSPGGTPACAVRELRSERPIPLRSSGSLTLSLDRDTYVAELDFDAPLSGVYRVSCKPAAGARSQALAVGERPRLALFGVLVVAAIASIALGIVLTGAVIALVAIRRNSHKRRLEREAMGG